MKVKNEKENLWTRKSERGGEEEKKGEFLFIYVHAVLDGITFFEDKNLIIFFPEIFAA